MGARFRNPVNGYEESVGHPGLWCLLFGSVYFAVKGIWTHAIASLVLACLTAMISWLVYPFFARSIVEKHYRRIGSIPVGSSERASSRHKQCPHCAETILMDAKICKHCRSQLSDRPA